MLLAFTGMMFLLLPMRLDQVGDAFIALLPANQVVEQYSDMISGGKLDVKEVIQPTYDGINKEYGLKEKQD